MFFSSSLFRRLFLALVAYGMVIGCSEFTPDLPPEDSLLDGPIDGLTPAQMGLFIAGDEEFGRKFTFNEGLGPVFNAASCDTYHPGDGRAHPEFGFVRFGRVAEDGTFDPMQDLGGPQLQDRAMPGYPPEEVPLGDNVVTSQFLAPSMTGLGLLEAVDDQVIMDLADPDDEDGDGISGRIQWVPASERMNEIAQASGSSAGRFQIHPEGYIGRFGRKASNISLLHQTVSAYHQDMGLTSDFATEDLFNPAVGPAATGGGPDPEVTSDVLFAVTFYLRTLRPPPRRNADAPGVLAGERHFAEIGCVDCHVPTLPTGVSALAPLSGKEARAYTDLLLHDMGPELDDGYAEGVASGSEWRTTPLWGLGLADSFTGGTPFYLHDGRASTLEAAIELHGGEGAASREGWRALSDVEKAELLAFLKSL